MQNTSDDENPKQYFLNHETLSMIWLALYDSENFILTKLLSDKMIKQGCKAMYFKDPDKLFEFWKDYLIKKELIIEKEMH